MSKSRRSSIPSAGSETGCCRLEWRPSRLIGAALWFLAWLAPCCLIGSDLPAAWAWPLAVPVLAFGMRDARRYRRLPACSLLVPAGRGAVQVDGRRIECLQLQWRGPLAFLDWRDGDGRGQRRVFAPDTLGAAGRRELKLAMQRREAAAGTASMAP